MTDLSQKTLGEHTLAAGFSLSEERSSSGAIEADKLILCLLLVLGSGLLYWLAIAVLSGSSSVFDSTALRLLHAYQDPRLDRFASLICMLVTLGSVFMLVYLCVRRRWRQASFWFCSTAGASILCGIAKKAIERHRPDLWSLASPHASFSFPSGHATQAAAFVIALFLLATPQSRRAILLPGLLWIFLVGVCRVYLGLHYPTDILAGWSMALAWVSLLGMLFPLPHAEARRGS